MRIMIVGPTLKAARAYAKKHEHDALIDAQRAETHNCCTILHRLEELRGADWSKIIVLCTPGWRQDWAHGDLVEVMRRYNIRYEEREM